MRELHSRSEHRFGFVAQSLPRLVVPFFLSMPQLSLEQAELGVMRHKFLSQSCGDGLQLPGNACRAVELLLPPLIDFCNLLGPRAVAEQISYERDGTESDRYWQTDLNGVRHA